MFAFSELQQERFLIHLADCHSWHKHLSLIKGGNFKITYDVNAGQNYPTQHPILPFENDFEGYQKAFGQLIFFWKNFDDINFHSDWQSSDFTEAELKDKYNLAWDAVLFPYLSADFVEAINFYKSDFEDICNGKEHEEKLKLTHIYHLHCEKENYWQTILTDEERELVVLDTKLNLSTNIQSYLDIEIELTILLRELRQKEINKVRDAIIKLRKNSR